MHSTSLALIFFLQGH